MSAFEGARMAVKLYAEEPVEVQAPELVPVFHRWIQDQVLTRHMPIDVANYSHVHRGPGVVLACHEGHYSFEWSDGQPGLQYRQKSAVEVGEPFREALRGALTACLLLQHEESLRGRLRFRADSILLQINDRLRAPNSSDSLARLRQYLRIVLPPLVGETTDVSIEPVGAATDLLGVLIRMEDGPGLHAFLGRVATPDR